MDMWNISVIPILQFYVTIYIGFWYFQLCTLFCLSSLCASVSDTRKMKGKGEQKNPEKHVNKLNAYTVAWIMIWFMIWFIWFLESWWFPITTVLQGHTWYVKVNILFGDLSWFESLCRILCCGMYVGTVYITVSSHTMHTLGLSIKYRSPDGSLQRPLSCDAWCSLRWYCQLFFPDLLLPKKAIFQPVEVFLLAVHITKEICEEKLSHLLDFRAGHLCLICKSWQLKWCKSPWLKAFTIDLKSIHTQSFNSVPLGGSSDDLYLAGMWWLKTEVLGESKGFNNLGGIML